MVTLADLADDTHQVRLGRNWLRNGDPCRWRGHHGYFRFVRIETHPTGERPAVLELIGPYYLNKPHNPRTRFALADQVVRVNPTDVMRTVVAGR